MNEFMSPMERKRVLNWINSRDDVHFGHLIESDGGEEIIVIDAYSNAEDKLETIWPEDLAGPDYTFSDSVKQCDNCHKWFYSTPGHAYDIVEWWQTDDGNIICRDCVKDELAEEYLEYILEKSEETGRSALANMLDNDNWLYDAGFVEIDLNFERGLRRQDRDNADSVMKAAKEFLAKSGISNKHGWKVDIVFTGYSTGFGMSFRPYARIREEMPDGSYALMDINVTDRLVTAGIMLYYKPDDEGPGDIAARQLKELSRQSRR